MNSEDYGPVRDIADTHLWNNNENIPQQTQLSDYEWLATRPGSTATSPAASTGVAAVQWLDLLTRDAYGEVQGHEPQTLEGGYLDPFNGHDEHATTPLQYATKTIDDQPPEQPALDVDRGEEALWQASQSIVLLDHEQRLFANFLHRICSWVRFFAFYVKGDSDKR